MQHPELPVNADYSIIHVVWRSESVFLVYNDDEGTPVFENGAYQAVEPESADRLAGDDEIYEYNFNEVLSDPLDCGAVLAKWNLLSDVAHLYRMYFEGDSRKYSMIYDELLRHSAGVDGAEQGTVFSQKQLSLIQKVFKKQHRQLNRLFGALHFLKA